MEQQPYQPPGDIFALDQRPLPNATAVLVLGILSIVFCFICGIVALVLSSGDKRLYHQEPHLYTSASYELLRAGRICSIIGICITGTIFLIWAIMVVFALSFASFNN
ncbi:MAG TPA: DUF4190 domain-containing protein [Flavisolibacter sp.]|jgi:hypothetical protein|nr:DUF4190 domain-containing protein [Flavisolibacter sp.]